MRSRRTKRALTSLLCVLVLMSVGGRVAARYDCTITGERNQVDCCCAHGEADDDFRCGCCDVRYEDLAPHGTKLSSGDTGETEAASPGPLFPVLESPLGAPTTGPSAHPPPRIPAFALSDSLLC